MNLLIQGFSFRALSRSAILPLIRRYAAGVSYGCLSVIRSRHE